MLDNCFVILHLALLTTFSTQSKRTSFATRKRKSKDDHFPTKDEHPSTKDEHFLTKDEHPSTKDEHFPTKDGHLSTKDGHFPTKDGHPSTKDEHFPTKESLLHTIWADSIGIK